MFVFLGGVSAFADTIYLKDGKAVIGEIKERKSFYVTIMQKGKLYKIYIDEIERIEEGDMDNAIDPATFIGVSPKKVKLILTFLEVSGTKAAMKANLEKSVKDAPVEKRAEISEMLDLTESIKRLIPVYSKYYDEKDLEELNAFYTSAAGQKMIDVTPRIMADVLNESLEFLKPMLERKNKGVDRGI